MAPLLAALLMSSLVATIGSARASATLRVPQDHPTIQAAINAAAPGDTIVIAPGTYNENLIIDKSVSLTAQSFDASDPRNNTSILDGGGNTVVTIRSGVLPGPSFTGLVIRNGKDGIFSRSPFSVDHSYLTDNVDSLQCVAGSSGAISDNLFEASNDDAIDINHPIKNFTIEDNRILQSGGDGIEIRINDDEIANTVEITIRGNRIVQSHTDGIQLIDYFEDTNRIFVIERNLIRDNPKAGIGMLDNGQSGEDFRAASIREPIHVFHNTFVGNDHGISGGDNVIALNNIFEGHVLALKNVDADSTASYNLFWDNATDFQGSSVDMTTTLFEDPLLDGSDHLGPMSPAIDAGVAHFEWRGDVVMDQPPSSYLGEAPDLGWLEEGGTSTNQPSISGFVPASGGPGTSVTISGSGFTNATAVRFNGTPATFSVASDTQITATVPSGATSGPIGVTGPGGTGTSAASFSVTTAAAATVIVKDYAFKPKKLQVAQGQVVGWTFRGPSAHTATDAVGLGAGGSPLFDSGSSGPGVVYEFAFKAAGSYPYASTNSEPSPMTGTIEVPVIASPAAGTTNTDFSVTWASSPLPGFRFSVQYRFRPQGSTTWGSWANFRRRQTAPAATFAPDQGAGTYQFRSRMENEATGRTSGYSTPTSISVA
jgi:plastocyanin